MMGITVYRCQQIKENNCEQSTVLYVIAVQSLKPAALRDTLTASQWSSMCFFLWHRAALITTAGNWTGILIGQVLGDFIIKINATKITPDMYIGKVWQLKAHYGVLIWLLVFLLSFVIGMIVEKKNHC